MNETKVSTNIGDVSSPKTKKASRPRYRYRPDVGPQPPFVIVSDNVGLGGEITFIRFRVPNGDMYDCGIENILRVIDLVQEPYRTALLAGAELEYGLPLGSMMGVELDLVGTGGAR